MRNRGQIAATAAGLLGSAVAAVAASTSPLPVFLSSDPFRDGMGGNAEGDEFTELSDWSQTTSTEMTTRLLTNSSSQLFPFQANHSNHFQPTSSTQGIQQQHQQGESGTYMREHSSSLFGSLFSHIDKQWKFAEIILIIVIAAILNLVTVVGNTMVLISFKMDRS